MTTVLDGVDRVALARAALARAEQRTGARSGLRASGHRAAPSTGTPSTPTTGEALSVTEAPSTTAPSTTALPTTALPTTALPTNAPSTTALQTTGLPTTGLPTTAASTIPSTTASSLTHPDRPPLPVVPDLAALLPDAALRRGASLVVTGSTSLLLALVAQASQEGSWVAVVGLPAVGLLAAQQAGVVLDRLALVPRPGPDAPTVLAALLDGVDVVIVGDGAALVDSDRRRLTARARERGTVLLSTTSWPGAHLVLTAEPVGWTGLGDGHGHLRRHRLAVTRGGRGSAGRATRAEVVLPVRPGTPGSRSAVAPGRREVEAVAPGRREVEAPAPLRLVG